LHAEPVRVQNVPPRLAGMTWARFTAGLSPSKASRLSPFWNSGQGKTSWNSGCQLPEGEVAAVEVEEPQALSGGASAKVGVLEADAVVGPLLAILPARADAQERR
jgi:hypothetical protein